MSRPAYANHTERARAAARLLDFVPGPALGAAAAILSRRPAAGGETIALIRCDHLGDYLMTTPAIRALRAARPAPRIEMLVSPAAAPALARNPDVTERAILDAPWYEPFSGREADPAGILASMFWLRGRRAAAVVEMRGDPRLLALAAFSGAPRRLGWSNLGLGRVLTEGRALDPAMPHGERAFSLLAALGAVKPAGEAGVRPVFRIEDADRREAGHLLGPHTRRPLVVIAPASNRPAHTWGASRFAAAAGILAAGGARIAVTGRGHEAGETAVTAAGAGAAALDLGGRTSLGSLAAILERADLLLANDSGTVHLAAAARCPSVALFGPTSPRLSFPYEGLRGSRALAGATPCARPCFDADCREDHGYGALTPESVAAACLGTLESNRAGAGSP